MISKNDLKIMVEIFWAQPLGESAQIISLSSKDGLYLCNDFYKSKKYK